MFSSYTPTVLTIAGFDPYGGAGIQVDSKVIHALGGYAFSVSTATTAQNSCGVMGVEVVSSKIFKMQLDTLLSDIRVDAIKIGMLGSLKNIEILIETIDRYSLKNIVLDTVLVSSSGKILLEKEAISLMQNELFKRVDIITPNIPEINTFLNTNYIADTKEIDTIAKSFFLKDINALLIKGGHSNDIS